MNARLSQLALVILVALGFGLLYAPPGGPPASTPSPSPVTPQFASAVPSVQAHISPAAPAMAPSDLEGVWTQWCDGDGERVWICKLRLTPAGTGYTATTVEVSPEAEDEEVVTSDHSYDGERWTFQQGPALFELQRTGPDEFQGQATVEGEKEDLHFTFKRDSR